jgi:hypothetical protein
MDHHGFGGDHSAFGGGDHGLSGGFHGTVDVNSHGTTVCGSGSISGHPINSGPFHDTTISGNLGGCISSGGGSSYSGGISVSVPLGNGW